MEQIDNQWLDAWGDRQARIQGTSRKPFALPVEMFGDIVPDLSNRWLIKGILPAEGAGVIFGHPGCGKSFLALDMALHLASGRSWMGRKVVQRPVVYLAAEGQAGLRLRVEAWRRHHRVEAAVPFALIPTAVDLLDPAADLGKLNSVLSSLSMFDEWCGIGLLVVDTLAATFGGGDENGSDMAAYLANINGICEPLGCSRIIVHHQPVTTDAKRPRGHGSLTGAADTTIHVSGDAGAPVRRATIVKQKDGQDGGVTAFSLSQVVLGEDEDGDPVTSCVVEPVDVSDPIIVDPFAKAVAKLSDGARLIYQQLGEAIAQTGTAIPSDIPASEINVHRVGKVALLSDWRDKSISAAGTDAGHSRDSGKKAFNRALTTLQTRGIVRVWEEWAWITYEVAGT